jgi:hypothetical protein
MYTLLPHECTLTDEMEAGAIVLYRFMLTAYRRNYWLSYRSVPPGGTNSSSYDALLLDEWTNSVYIHRCVSTQCQIGAHAHAHAHMHIRTHMLAAFVCGVMHSPMPLTRGAGV